MFTNHKKVIFKLWARAGVWYIVPNFGCRGLKIFKKLEKSAIVSLIFLLIALARCSATSDSDQPARPRLPARSRDIRAVVAGPLTQSSVSLACMNFKRKGGLPAWGIGPRSLPGGSGGERQSPTAVELLGPAAAATAAAAFGLVSAAAAARHHSHCRLIVPADGDRQGRASSSSSASSQPPPPSAVASSALDGSCGTQASWGERRKGVWDGVPVRVQPAVAFPASPSRTARLPSAVRVRSLRDRARARRPRPSLRPVERAGGGSRRTRMRTAASRKAGAWTVMSVGKRSCSRRKPCRRRRHCELQPRRSARGMPLDPARRRRVGAGRRQVWSCA